MQIDGQQSWKPAESYNSILNKFVGGKRINFSLKGFYEGRCYAATISYHTKGQFISTISQELNNGNIGKYTMEYSEKVNKLRQNRKVTGRKVKNRACSTDSDYGQNCEAFSVILFQNLARLLLNNIDFAQIQPINSFIS
jgi:hypothetical protein